MISYCRPEKIKIVLASSSPRRKFLLEQIGIKFTILKPNVQEVKHKGSDFAKTVLHNAEIKALSVVSSANGLPILGADTLVDLDGNALGKPSDSADAVSMLSRLSGKIHRVYSGIVVIESNSGTIHQDYAVTEVQFRDLSDEEIDDYVCSGDPFDKAGSYGIQRRGALLVDSIDGCFYNVMGLPLSKLWQILQKVL